MARLKNKKKKTPGLNEIQCPNCGETVNKDAVFCQACNSFLTDDGKGLLPPEKVTDADLQTLFDQSQEDQKKSDQTTRGKVSILLSRLSFVFYLLILIMGIFGKFSQAFICIGVTVVLMILGFIIKPRAAETILDAKDLEEIITKYIAAVECKNIYGSETSFGSHAALTENVIRKASFCSSDYTKYEGNRLIQSTWNGYPFSACHVKLMNFHSQNGHERAINIFDGYCMSIDTNLIFPEEIRIIEKYLGCLTQVLKEEKEESALFYDIYDVKSEHSEKAEDFLTSELRKNIILTGRQYAGSLAIVLNPNGNIFIAAGGGEDAFAENQTAEEIRIKYRKELEFPLKVLQCFLDVENNR